MKFNLDFSIDEKSIRQDIEKDISKQATKEIIDYRVKQSIEGNIITLALTKAFEHTSMKSVLVGAMEYYYVFPSMLNGLIDIKVYKWNHISNTITSGFVPLKSFAALDRYYQNNKHFPDDILYTEVPEGAKSILLELAQQNVVDYKKLSGSTVYDLHIKRFGKVIDVTLGQRLSIFNTVYVESDDRYQLIHIYTLIYDAMDKHFVGVDSLTFDKELLDKMLQDFNSLKKEVEEVKKEEQKKEGK